MGTSRSLGEMSRKLQNFGKDISGPIPVRQFAIRADKELVPLLARAVRADIGDTSMSGWWRGRPIAMTGSLKVNGDAIIIQPVRGAVGPTRVMEQGRNQGNASGFSGPGINVKTGLTSRTKSGGIRKVRARKGRRNGATQGKGTWSAAEEAMRDRAPRVQQAVVRAALRKRF